jgi:hypothetical protein
LGSSGRHFVLLLSCAEESRRNAGLQFVKAAVEERRCRQSIDASCKEEKRDERRDRLESGGVKMPATAYVRGRRSEEERVACRPAVEGSQEIRQTESR